ncbi:MAG: BMP family ABC transporter substrate-binding protein [Chthonomonas sp.]|nr:BMP family ABC transporter substrate-binding protein [Chthonomonas sp.]
MQWIVAAGLTVGIIGCGKNDAGTEGASAGTGGKVETPSGEKKMKIAVVYDSGGRGDKSFNDSAWNGIERARQDFGIESVEVESKAAKDYEGNLSQMAEDGADLVIAVGLAQGEPLAKVAANFPDTKFAIVDGSGDAKNIRSLKFKEEEGSFLVGVAAGMVSKTGKIGFVGGQEIDLIKKFEYGFYAGAKWANPNIVILPAKYTGSWDDQGKGKDLAALLFSQGADVVYAAAGRAGLGTIKAAKDAGKFCIGVDSDQDDLEKGVVLTSMIKRVDEAVYATIKDLKEGKYSAGETIYDLKSNGVGTSDFRNTKSVIGDAGMKKIEEAKAKIIAGEVKVPANQAEFNAK